MVTVRARLAEQCVAKQIVRTHAWREVWERTSRHPYVPGHYLDDIPPVLGIDDRRRSEWLDAVDSDTTGYPPDTPDETGHRHLHRARHLAHLAPTRRPPPAR